MPKIVDHEKKRLEFMQATMELIASDGYSAATLRNVANKAGYTTGSLTNYFPDRKTLILAMLKMAHNAAAARMTDVASVATNDYQRLIAVLLESLPLDKIRLKEWRIWIAFWGESLAEKALLKENKTKYKQWSDALEQLVTPLASNSGSVKDHVYRLVALVDGLSVVLVMKGLKGKALETEQKRCEQQLRHYIKQHFGE